MLERLRRDGICEVGAFFVGGMLKHLSTKKRWNNHVKQDGVEPGPDPSSTCWSMEDVITAPLLLEQANVFLPLAREYLDAPPQLYSVNAFTTYPRQGPTQVDIQEFHRDEDDVKFLVLFVYLTPVLTTDDGPHEYKLGTHEGKSDGPTVKVIGWPGTMFLADTRGLHRGVRPTVHPRTLAWVRWGVSDPPKSYGLDKLSPVPSSLLGDRWAKFGREERESMRLVMRDDT